MNTPLPESPLAASLARESCVLGAEKLAKTYHGATVFEGLDLRLAEASIVALVGPNGAGKTTLLRLLLGLEMPDAGHVWRRPGLSIGYVSQRLALSAAIPLTVGAFLRLGLSKRWWEPSWGGRSGRRGVDLRAALAEVGLSPGHVDRSLHVLSGGELRRVLLARALLRRPALLVLDEPMSGIDPVGHAMLYQLLASYRQASGMTVLLVSHDLEAAMGIADRVIGLSRGIAVDAPPAALDAGEMGALFGLPSGARPVFPLPRLPQPGPAPPRGPMSPLLRPRSP